MVDDQHLEHFLLYHWILPGTLRLIRFPLVGSNGGQLRQYLVLMLILLRLFILVDNSKWLEMGSSRHFCNLVEMDHWVDGYQYLVSSLMKLFQVLQISCFYQVIPCSMGWKLMDILQHYMILEKLRQLVELLMVTYHNLTFMKELVKPYSMVS